MAIDLRRRRRVLRICRAHVMSHLPPARARSRYRTAHGEHPLCSHNAFTPPYGTLALSPPSRAYLHWSIVPFAKCPRTTYVLCRPPVSATDHARQVSEPHGQSFAQLTETFAPLTPLLCLVRTQRTIVIAIAVSLVPIVIILAILCVVAGARYQYD